MKKLTSILPMRAGSKRVPDKNIRLFDGKPLFRYMLDTLKSAQSVDQIIVDTDCEAIIDYLKSDSDIILSRRPESLAGDFASMNDVIGHVLSANNTGDYFVQVHATSPLLNSNSIDDAFNHLIKGGDVYDSVFSVTSTQARFFKKDGSPVNHNPKELIRTQDLEPIYEENSGFYLFTRQSFEKSGKKRIGLRPHMWPILKIEAIDIDDESDFIIAESIYKALKG